MVREKKTRMIRAGSRTYFFDLRETQNHRKYLAITLSHWTGNGQEHERTRLTVFPEQAEEFVQIIKKMTAGLV